MGLFGINNNPNDNFPNKATTQQLTDLVGDGSVFGKFYKKICDILKERNVPSTRFPSRNHFMSRLMDFIDEQKLNDWLEKYAEMEAINVDADELNDDEKQ